MAFIIPALPYITAAVAAVGAIQQGNAASKSAKSQAQALDYNAKVDEGQADTARQISTQEQLAHRRRVNQVQGMQRAAVAQSGTGFEGSNDDILDQSATLAELDALNLAYQGERRAQGFTSQSALDAYNAMTARSNASAERTGGYLKAAGAASASLSRLYAPTTPEAKTVVGQRGTFFGLSTRGGTGLKIYGT